MKTLYLSDSSANLVVDPEEDFVGTMQSEDRYVIRNLYYAEEPIHVVYQSGERREEIDAKKGDLIIVFYNDRFNKYILDTVRSKQWIGNIKNRRAIEQKEKEEWAAKNAEKCENCDAPCCCDCCECPCTNTGPFEEAAPIEEAAPKKESAAKKLRKAIKKVIKKA